jgi:hypothetical protein
VLEHLVDTEYSIRSVLTAEDMATFHLTSLPVRRARLSKLAELFFSAYKQTADFRYGDRGLKRGTTNTGSSGASGTRVSGEGLADSTLHSGDLRSSSRSRSKSTRRARTRPHSMNNASRGELLRMQHRDQ